MPTYEYTCENHHNFEEFQSILAEPLKICPICGGKAERKISGGTGLIFKGSGFYITDYKKSNSSSATSSRRSTSEKSTEEKSTPETTTPPPAPPEPKKTDDSK
jgi:putative FmdB family regulatory protein